MIELKKPDVTIEDLEYVIWRLGVPENADIIGRAGIVESFVDQILDVDEYKELFLPMDDLETMTKGYLGAYRGYSLRCSLDQEFPQNVIRIIHPGTEEIFAEIVQTS